jgi:hypothetical protein
MVICAGVTVDVTKDWFDYLVAVLTAVGTVGAVIVAVSESYRRNRREQQTRPQLTVELDQAALGAGCFRADGRGRFDGHRYLAIEVSNALGRRTAHQVEVLASWSSITNGEFVGLGEHIPLRLLPRDGHSFSLGPGITRRLELLELDASMLTSEGHDTRSIGTLTSGRSFTTPPTIFGW